MRKDITGQRVAVVLMADAVGVPDTVHHGLVVEDLEGLSIQHSRGLLKLSEEWASRIGPLEPAASRARLGADFVLPMTVERLSPMELASLKGAGLELPSAGQRGAAQ